MSNREKIINKISGLGFKLGCYHNQIDLMSEKNLNKVLKQLTGDSEDIETSINRKPYLIEVSTVDDEMDFILITKQEYISRYGDEKFLDC